MSEKEKIVLGSNGIKKVLKGFSSVEAVAEYIWNRYDANSIEDDYKKILLQNRERLMLALNSGSTNTLSDRIVNILKNVNEHAAISEIGKSLLLKKLIVNMSNELNHESEYMSSMW